MLDWELFLSIGGETTAPSELDELLTALAAPLAAESVSIATQRR
jgi:hypothetical protein